VFARPGKGRKARKTSDDGWQRTELLAMKEKTRVLICTRLHSLSWLRK
jgi:hypothetical protein